MTKRKPLSGKSWRGMPLGIYIIPLVCYLGLEPSSISKVSVGNTDHSFTRGLFPLFFACPFLGCDRRRNTNSKENRSSPLYAICLNWIHEIQFVDFDSKLFYGRHCQIEPDGEHPTSRAAMIGFEPMIPVRCRMLDPFITLAAGFKADP